MNVTLPDGQSAVLRPVLHSTRLALEALARKEQKALDAGDEITEDYVAAVIVILTESWSLGDLSADSIAATPERVVNALYRRAMANFRAETEDPLPQA